MSPCCQFQRAFLENPDIWIPPVCFSLKSTKYNHFPDLQQLNPKPSGGKALGSDPENDLNSLGPDFDNKLKMSSKVSGGYKVMYQSPGDKIARYYINPPPPTHGWKKYTYNGETRKVSMMSHSPERGQERTQRRASRTRSYAEDYSDPRLTSDGYKVMYQSPSDTIARYYTNPPPPTHGWKKYTYNPETRKVSMMSHSPERGQERTRRPAPRTQSYANDYNDWRQTRDDNNSRRHEKKARQPSSPYDRDPHFSSSSSSSRPQNTQTPVPNVLPDHYATLRVSPFASPAEIRKAAKTRRIEVHPDTMRRKAALQGGKLSRREEEEIERVAKEVGEAAEVLENRKSKVEFDAEKEEEAESKKGF